MKKGKLIVIDGIDGSGKTTQIELLTKNLQVPYEVISFPRYEDNLYAQLVGRYLEGEFGGLSNINPYFLSLAYAGDRLLAKPVIENWLADGKLVIANRYVSANKAHMGANLPAEKSAEFFKWLDALEYSTNGLPKEDLTIILVVDPKVGSKNVSDSRFPDLHEENEKYLEKAQEIYLSLAKTEKDWYLVDCMNGGSMRAREDIHQDIKRILKEQLHEI